MARVRSAWLLQVAVLLFVCCRHAGLAFTLATASASELRAMVKQLMASKMELERAKSLLEAETKAQKKKVEEQERTIEILKTTKRDVMQAAGGVDPALKLIELQDEVRFLKEENVHGSHSSDSKVRGEPATYFQCDMLAHNMLGGQAVMVDHLNASRVPTVVRSALALPPGTKTPPAGPGGTRLCGVEAGDLVVGALGGVPVAQVSLQQAIEAAFARTGKEATLEARWLLPLVGVEEDGGGQRSHEPTRGARLFGKPDDDDDDDDDEVVVGAAGSGGGVGGGVGGKVSRLANLTEAERKVAQAQAKVDAIELQEKVLFSRTALPVEDFEDVTKPHGFALQGFLDVRILPATSATLTVRFEAPRGTQHRKRLDQEFQDSAKHEAEQLAAERAELEQKRARLGEAQRKEGEEREAKAARVRQIEEENLKERGEELAAQERKRKEQEARETTREWMRSQWETWRSEGKAYDYDVEVKEDEAAKHNYAIGVSFNPMGPPVVVDSVKPGSLAFKLKIGVGDIMLAVGEKNVSSMRTDVAVRTLTLAEWPRTLYFHVPERAVAVEENDDESEAAINEFREYENVAVLDEAQLAAQMELYMRDPAAAEAAEKEARRKAMLAPRKKGRRRKRPESLVLRITDPELLAGDYSMPLASGWGSVWEGPDHYIDDMDDNIEAQLAWPCVPLPLTTTDPVTGCGEPAMTVPHVAGTEGFVPVETHEGAWGKGPEDLPMIALVVRGTCVFTDKVRALHPLMLPETSIGGGGNGEGSLVAVAVVVNTDNAPLDVPAGRVNVDDISITVTSLNASSGDILRDAVGFGALKGSDSTGVAPNQRVYGWVGSPEDCDHLRTHPAQTLEQRPAEAREWQPNEVPAGGGKFLLLSSHGDMLGPYDFKAAMFGPSSALKLAKAKEPAAHAPVRFVVADPLDGCDPRKYKVRVKGLWVLTVRGGGCGFADKVLAVQSAGASGVVVVQKSGHGLPSAMMADDVQSAEVKIPAYMVSLGLMEDVKLLESLRERNPELKAQKPLTFIGRLVFEDFYGAYDEE